MTVEVTDAGSFDGNYPAGRIRRRVATWRYAKMPELLGHLEYDDYDRMGRPLAPSDEFLK